MKKFFENLSEKFNDAAFEAQLDDFTCEFDAINKPAEIVVSANSTSKCKITKCFCKSTPLVLRNSISFLVSH